MFDSALEIMLCVTDILPSLISPLPCVILHCSSFLLVSSMGQYLEQKPHGGSGFVPSWRPHFPPTVETPTPLASALVFSGLPLPSQTNIYKTDVAFSSEQDAGTEKKKGATSIFLLSFDSS